MMMIMIVSEMRPHLYWLLDEVAESYKQVIITHKSSNGILNSEEEWNSIPETLKSCLLWDLNPKRNRYWSYRKIITGKSAVV